MAVPSIEISNQILEELEKIIKFKNSF